MKKLLLLGGVGIGYVLGSRAGHGPYEKLDSEVRRLFGRGDVAERLDQATVVATDKASATAHAAADKSPGSHDVPQPKEGADITMTLGSE